MTSDSKCTCNYGVGLHVAPCPHAHPFVPETQVRVVRPEKYIAILDLPIGHDQVVKFGKLSLDSAKELHTNLGKAIEDWESE